MIRFAIDQYPVLLADILLTAPLNTPADLQFPSVRTLRLPPESNKKPALFRQKIALISDDFLVGWAGKALLAQHVINELISVNKSRPFTPDSLKNYIERLHYKLPENAEFGLLGIIRDRAAEDVNNPEGIRATLFHYGGEEFQLEHYGNIGMLGTGKDDAKKILIQESGFLKSEHGYSTAELGIASALRISGRLLSDEFAKQDSLKNLYGAGYEMAFFMDHRFQKLDDVVYLQWVARMFDRSIKLWLFNVSKFKYVNDLLTVRIARFDMQTSELQIAPSLTIIQPIEKTINEDFDLFPRPDFNSLNLCSNLLVAHPITDRMRSFTFVEGGPGGVPSIEFEEQGALLTYRFRDQGFPQFLEDLFKRWLSEKPN